MTGENHRLCGPANGDGTSRRINSLIFEQANRKIYAVRLGRRGTLRAVALELDPDWCHLQLNSRSHQ